MHLCHPPQDAVAIKSFKILKKQYDQIVKHLKGQRNQIVHLYVSFRESICLCSYMYMSLFVYVLYSHQQSQKTAEPEPNRSTSRKDSVAYYSNYRPEQVYSWLLTTSTRSVLQCVAVCVPLSATLRIRGWISRICRPECDVTRSHVWRLHTQTCSYVWHVQTRSYVWHEETRSYIWHVQTASDVSRAHTHMCHTYMLVHMCDVSMYVIIHTKYTHPPTQISKAKRAPFSLLHTHTHIPTYSHKSARPSVLFSLTHIQMNASISLKQQDRV